MGEIYAEILDGLKELNKEYKIRFGLAVQMVADRDKRTQNYDLSQISDKEFLSALGELRNRVKDASEKGKDISVYGIRREK